MTITTTADVPTFVVDENAPGWVALLEPAARLAEVLARTEFVPKAFRGRPEAVAAAILYGHELGIGPLQALRGIDVVEGQPAPNAELMRALVLKSGHDVWVVESSGSRVRMAGRRAGSTHTVEVEWSLEMARAAGLASKDVWKRYPRAMLTARATTELCRLLFPDVIGGLSFLAEELEPEPDPPKTTRSSGQPTHKVARRAALTGPDAPGSEGNPASPAGLSTLAGRDASRPDVSGSEQPPPMGTVDEPPAGAEQGPQAAPAGPNSPSDAASRKLHALLTSAGIITRPDRLSFAAELVGHPVASSSELSAPEVGNLIDTLEQIEAGVVGIDWLDDPITGLRTPSLRLAEPEDS